MFPSKVANWNIAWNSFHSVPYKIVTP